MRKDNMSKKLLKNCKPGDVGVFFTGGDEYEILAVRQLSRHSLVELDCKNLVTCDIFLGLSYVDTTGIYPTKEQDDNSMNELQDKVWKHLLSGRGDIEKRQLALRMLSADGFFTSEEDIEVSAEALRNLVKQDRYTAEFCYSGLDRVLALIPPPKPKYQQRARIVIEVDVDPAKGVNGLFDGPDRNREGRLSQVPAALEGMVCHSPGLNWATRTLHNAQIISMEEVK
jgi:hypothetical protein